mgnify:CR=1 FL=1
MWDLRGGSSGALHLGSSGVYHHPVLCSLNLRLALTAVPGLASQTVIPATAIQWLQVGLVVRTWFACHAVDAIMKCQLKGS